GEKVPGDVRGKIESAVSQLREAAKGDDGTAIKNAIEKLAEVSQELGKILYEEAAKQQAAQAPPQGDAPQDEPPEPEAKKRDDVIDAEFEAKDD
ncbi:hypothetical protein LCGC14_2680470, partial [marine sediment metagenome]